MKIQKIYLRKSDSSFYYFGNKFFLGLVPEPSRGKIRGTLNGLSERPTYPKETSKTRTELASKIVFKQESEFHKRAIFKFFSSNIGVSCRTKSEDVPISGEPLKGLQRCSPYPKIHQAYRRFRVSLHMLNRSPFLIVSAGFHLQCQRASNFQIQGCSVH